MRSVTPWQMAHPDGGVVTVPAEAFDRWRKVGYAPVSKQEYEKRKGEVSMMKVPDLGDLLGIDLDIGARVVIETDDGFITGSCVSWSRRSDGNTVKVKPDATIKNGGFFDGYLTVPLEKVSYKPDARDKEIERLRAELEQLKTPAPTDDDHLNKINALVDKALPRAIGILSGSHKPRMCIPVQPDDDDQLIIGALGAIPVLIAEVRRLKATNQEER
jgi:hypothetical protein